MNVLAATLAAATDDEIRAARRLVHRVAEARRLRADPARHYPPILSPAYPPLLAAVCVDLDAELVRRGSPFAGCPPCRSTLGLVADKRLSIPSAAIAAEGGL